MDDAYIHFVYAQNLADYGSLFFNLPVENGLGTTSLAWVMLLALGLKAGIPSYLTAKALGMISLAVVGGSIYVLFCSIWRPLPSLIAALAVVLSGNMLWFALNGMETVMFLAIGMLALLAYRQEKWVGWIPDKNRRPWVVFSLWVILHNIIYMAALPTPGTASRYGAINHIALWLALIIGMYNFAHRPRLQLLLAGGLGLIAVINTGYWNDVYNANIVHMREVRIAAAQYIAETFPPEELCAASDIGALRYFSRRPIVDICGLINPDQGRVFLAGETDRYLVDRNVSCLILPGRTGRMEDGWFDHAEVFGLSSSPLFEMHKIIDFEIDRELWLKGYLPTNNNQATVTIYRLER